MKALLLRPNRRQLVLHTGFEPASSSAPRISESLQGAAVGSPDSTAVHYSSADQPIDLAGWLIGLLCCMSIRIMNSPCWELFGIVPIDLSKVLTVYRAG